MSSESSQPFGSQQLGNLCREHTRRFRRSQPHNPAYCLELWQRALFSEPRDVEAWGVIYETYERQIAAWVRRAAAGVGTTISDDQTHDLVFDCIEKFRSDAIDGKFQIPQQINPLLSFLSQRVQWMTIDRLRMLKIEVELGDLVHDDEDLLENIEAQQRQNLCLPAYNQAIKRCKNVFERQLLHEIFIEGTKAGILLARHPNEFSNITQVYKAIRNLGERLERDITLKGIYAQLQALQIGK